MKVSDLGAQLITRNESWKFWHLGFKNKYNRSFFILTSTYQVDPEKAFLERVNKWDFRSWLNSTNVLPGLKFVSRNLFQEQLEITLASPNFELGIGEEEIMMRRYWFGPMKTLIIEVDVCI